MIRVIKKWGDSVEIKETVDNLETVETVEIIGKIIVGKILEKIVRRLFLFWAEIVELLEFGELCEVCWALNSTNEQQIINKKPQPNWRKNWGTYFNPII